MSGVGVECFVKSASPDSEFVAVQVVKGEIVIDDQLTCVETGRRYQIMSFGFTPIDAHVKGVCVLQLAVADGLPAGNELQKGMHLVSQ